MIYVQKLHFQFKVKTYCCKYDHILLKYKGDLENLHKYLYFIFIVFS